MLRCFTMCGLLLFTICLSASSATIKSSQPYLITQLDWYTSHNQTQSSISASPGSIYNIMKMPVLVGPSAATITLINMLEIPITIQWPDGSQDLPKNSSTDVVALGLVINDNIPFNITYQNGTLIKQGSVSDLKVDTHAVISVYERTQRIDVISLVYHPCYQLQFRDRDQMKLFMIQAEPIEQQDWIYTDGYQMGFNLTFHFTIPIQSFNFYAFSLLRYDKPTGSTTSFLPRSDAPLLHLVPYWYSITPRWNNELQTGDQLTVAGSFSVGPQSLYICWFKVYNDQGNQVAGLSSSPVATNNTGMFQCIVPDLTSILNLVQSGDVLHVVPGFLESWRSPPTMYQMTQVESQDNRFTLILPSNPPAWWSFQSWPIYVVIGVGVLLVLVIYFLLLRYLCRRRRRSAADLSEVNRNLQADARSIIEAQCNDIQPQYSSQPSQSNLVQVDFDSEDMKPPASEPIDMQYLPKVLVKPSRFQWIQKPRRDENRERLL